MEGVPVKNPSSKTVHLDLKELDKVQSLDDIEAFIKRKIDQSISVSAMKPKDRSSPQLSKAEKSTPATSDEETEAKIGFRSCNCAAARQTMTDRELFDKLLRIFEKQEGIVEKLSQDEHFIKSQLKQVKSRRSLEEMMKNVCRSHKCQHAMTSEVCMRKCGWRAN